MERCKIYTRLIKLRGLALALLLALCCLPSLEAQTKARRGLWLEFGGEIGTTLKRSDYEAVPPGNFSGNNKYFTVGMHFKQLPKLQAGVGFNSTTYGHPNDFTHYGIHLDLRYNPWKYELRNLQFSLRTTLLFVYGYPTFYNADYTPDYAVELAVGWELPRLLGTWGINPAIGVSYEPFSYQYCKREPEKTALQCYRHNSSQAMIFLRLGILLN